MSSHPHPAQPLVVFSHGNSFPASTYRVMLESLQLRGFTVAAIEKYGHDPRFPVTSCWPHLVEQLAEFASAQARLRPGVPVFLAGHSLGGFLSLMCAAQHPWLLSGQRIAGVLLLDSPVLGGWKAAALAVVKKTGKVGSFAPGAISKKRRDRWPGAAEALAHFQGKKSFALWDAAVLQDYIEHGTHDALPAATTESEGVAAVAVSEGMDINGKSNSNPDSNNPKPERLLSFDRAIETAIYNGLPHNLEVLLKRHPLQCPVTFIGGLDSVEIRQVGLRLTRSVTQGRMMMVGGTHLFPMEQPLAAAAAMEAALRSMASEAARR